MVSSFLIGPSQFPVRAELEQCVMMATHSNPNLRKRGPLVAFMKGVETLNVKEYIGVLNSLRGLPISPTSVGRQAAMEMMAVVVSRGFHMQYPELTMQLRDLWDQALSGQLGGGQEGKDAESDLLQHPWS